MKRFKKILALCNQNSTDTEVLERVTHLARANEASVTLASIIDNSAGDLVRLYSSLPGVRARDVEHEITEFHYARLKDYAQKLEASDIKSETLVLAGTPFVETIRQVLRGDFDLVIKSAEGKQVGRRRLFASVDLHLLRKCPCPVWIVQPGNDFRNKRILAAVDPDPGDQQRDSVSRMVMDLATSLSKADGAELHVVRVWRLYGENAMRHSAFLRTSEDTLEALLAEQESQADERLKRLLTGYDIIYDSSRIHLIKGDPAEVLTAFAQTSVVDAIVMGTVGRSGVQGLLIGNTAETVLNEVTCSIIAVKPPGFVTPVAP